MFWRILSLVHPLQMEHFRDAVYNAAMSTFGKRTSKSVDWFEAHSEEMTPVIEAKRNALLIYAHGSLWSIGHLRPFAIALCFGLLWPFQSNCPLVVLALPQCLASNCCEAGFSSSFPAGSRSEPGV